MVTKMWILVFAGSPAGDPRSAHTGLYMEHQGDGENKGTHFQVVGKHPLFRLERRDGFDPSKRVNLRNRVPVAHMAGSITRADARVVLTETRLKNSMEDADWNCRNWVGDVLQRMVARQWLTKEQRDKALDKMIELCLDIEDEDQ